MGEDASLNDFLGGSDERAETDSETADGPIGTDSDDERTGTTERTDSTPAEGTDPVPTAEALELATTTYAWDGAGAACDECGEVAERRWQQDGELVCVACKEW